MFVIRNVSSYVYITIESHINKNIFNSNTMVRGTEREKEEDDFYISKILEVYNQKKIVDHESIVEIYSSSV